MISTIKPATGNLHKYGHLALCGVLCLFLGTLSAQKKQQPEPAQQPQQLKPKELRKDVLESVSPTKPAAKPAKGKPAAKKKEPLPVFKPLAPTASPDKKSGTLVYLEDAEVLTSNKLNNPDIQVIKGNVRFRHDNALLYCDSAYFYQKANSLDAFGNVRIVQADTLFVYGDVLYYDGNIKLARLRRNVRMENRKTTLTTDSLNYDRMANLAYYYTGGKIMDDVNTLTSVWGQYSPATNEAVFKTKVNLVNKDFVLNSDTLRYNTKSNVANLVGPTHILYNNETDIHSTKGWYNTSTQKSMLLDRSLVIHKDGKTLTGDTIFYDKTLKYGEGFSNVVMVDSVQKATLYGDYLYYNEATESGLATDSALLVDWSTKDTMYVHADTLLTSKDSIYDVARGFYNVRFYRNDVQGLCDSLAYSARDSIMNMYGQPVLWSDNNQLSGEFIQAFTKNSKVEKIHIQQAAMAIQREDSLYFNQLSGKEIIAYVDSGELRKVNVNGNAETIYYPRDDKDSTIVGINKTQSSFVVMYLKDKKVDRIVMTSASTGTMYPLEQLSGGDLFLKNYFWLEEQRPAGMEDLFLTFPAQNRPKAGGNGNSKNNGNGKTSADEALPAENQQSPTTTAKPTAKPASARKNARPAR